MTRRLASAVGLFLAVQYRSGFVHVYLGVAAVTIAIGRFLVPDSWKATIGPAVMLGEYGTMGFYMVAAQSYLARNERSIEALRVTPLTAGERVLALVLAPSLLAMVAGSSVFAGILGLDVRTLYLLVPLFATTVLAGSLGLVLASRYDEFTRFLLGSIPVMVVSSLPFLSYFGLVPRYSFAWLPWDAALFAFKNLAQPSPRVDTYVVLGTQIVGLAALSWYWVVKLETSAT